MAKNRNLTESQLANLKRDAGPGRPLGQRNFKTIYLEALKKIGEANGKDIAEMEVMFQEVGLKHALKGNFQFWKDLNDRIHGKTPDVTQMSVTVEANPRIKDLAKKLNK